MNMAISSLVLAIRAMEEAIAKYELLAGDESLSDEDLDYYGQYVLDLQKAFGELGGVYDELQKAHPNYPTFDAMIEKSAQQKLA
jgi:hypothetical protein